MRRETNLEDNFKTQNTSVHIEEEKAYGTAGPVLELPKGPNQPLATERKMLQGLDLKNSWNHIEGANTYQQYSSTSRSRPGHSIDEKLRDMNTEPFIRKEVSFDTNRAMGPAPNAGIIRIHQKQVSVPFGNRPKQPSTHRSNDHDASEADHVSGSESKNSDYFPSEEKGND